MIKTNRHIHTFDDGRGNRDVWLDGKLVQHCLLADVKRGVVKLARQPFKLDKYKKRLLVKTVHGRVEVVPHDQN